MEERANALLAAVDWLRDVLLGGAATSVAIAAVAGVGLAMLTGRIDRRRGLGVVLGCFILFGAPIIARGLTRWTPAPSVVLAAPPPLAPEYVAAPPRAPASDPYAGAAVPTQR